MVIVTGVFEVDPAQRDEFLCTREPGILLSRAEAGNLEYVFSADPMQPNRVVLFELWEDKAALTAHMVGYPSRPVPVEPEVPAITSIFTQYEVLDAGPLGG